MNESKMGPFSVQRAGWETVIVDHPVGSPKFYQVDPETYWEQSLEGQMKSAIMKYDTSIDLEKSDMDVAVQIHKDAKDIGVYDV